MNEEYNTISRKELFDLNEDDLMFITNPGRMGDEDGSTFIIKKGNEFISYRVDGWMYSTKKERNSENFISYEDMCNVFPEWRKAWHDAVTEKKPNEKYKFIPMGFGNGLCVDTRIYDKYYPYLIAEIKKKTNAINDENQYDNWLNFTSWEQAFTNMVENEKVNIILTFGLRYDTISMRMSRKK